MPRQARTADQPGGSILMVAVRAWPSWQRVTARAIWGGHAGPCERKLASRKSATQVGVKSTAQAITTAVRLRPGR